VPHRVVDAVRTRRAFAALSRSRTRGRSGPLWVVRADPPADSPEATGPAVRVAFAIGRGVGGAVVRNRVRRRLRALVDDLARLYLFGATPAAVVATPEELRTHLTGALGALR
jgi:ribonuclease P protein component